VDTRSDGFWRLLWPALALSSLGYIGLALWFPLLPNLWRTPAADILTFSDSPAMGLAYGALLIILFLLLIVAFRGIWRRGLWGSHQARPAAQSLVLILGVTLLFGLPLVLTYPVNANDIFRYAQRGRITALYGGNPFTEPLTTYPDDPFRPLAGEWAGETTPYGPVWEGMATVAARVTPGSMGGTLLAFKATGLLLLLATSAVLWALLARVPTDRRAAYVVLWAWNPALLLTFVGNGHNDSLMLLWLLLALWALRRGRAVIGLWLVALAVLSKPVAALVLPFYLIDAWRRTPAPRRPRLVVGAAGGAALLTALSFLPWAGRGGLLASPLALVDRMVREAAGGAGFSPATFVYFALQEAGLDVPIQTIGTVFLSLFLVAYAVFVWRTWRGGTVARGAAAAFGGYILQALNFRIWYAAWPFAFLIDDAAERNEADLPLTYAVRAGFWFLLTSQLSVIIYSHLRIFLLDERHAQAHLIGVPFTFLLPWVLARWSWFPTGQQRSTRRYITPDSGHTA
jgi:hypothetical protein